jgi:acyl-coenzyme A synthetase/AMP-(fatty) acid ligase
MVHAGLYGLYRLYFKNVFNYEENDIFWCTADMVGLQVILIFCMAPY